MNRLLQKASAASQSDDAMLHLLDEYAHRLKSTHSAEFLTEQVSMLEDYAARNMGAKHYSHIR